MNRYVEAEFRDRLAAAKERAEKAEAQVRAVRELHQRCIDVPVQDGGCTLDEHEDAGDPPICLLDVQDWPCATIRALDGGDGNE